MTNKEKLFDLLDAIAEYHPDVEPEETDSEDDLLEKYFYWITEYNAGYSYELEHPDESEFNEWICENAERFMEV